jgi:transcriptional antiterminator
MIRRIQLRFKEKEKLYDFLIVHINQCPPIIAYVTAN